MLGHRLKTAGNRCAAVSITHVTPDVRDRASAALPRWLKLGRFENATTLDSDKTAARLRFRHARPRTGANSSRPQPAAASLRSAAAGFGLELFSAGARPRVFKPFSTGGFVVIYYSSLHEPTVGPNILEMATTVLKHIAQRLERSGRAPPSKSRARQRGKHQSPGWPEPEPVMQPDQPDLVMVN
ncbi:hypothetical protein HaLaN_03146 [Haematococcus lacustris]|uniref:Uncharacterized protein n=1 Tax=Haematococcus lacustris TaxID=44745 RepID=A0A699YMT7_HAELA|nr:hypothetical protein HaLaN_03146 [Haematococcus lacustris]